MKSTNITPQEKEDKFCSFFVYQSFGKETKSSRHELTSWVETGRLPVLSDFGKTTPVCKVYLGARETFDKEE